MLFFKFLRFIQDRFCVEWSKILTASTEACSGRPIALGSTQLASFRHSITRSFARRLTNLQIIGFGPRSLLLGTRWAVSISSIDTSAPISLNRFKQRELVALADSVALSSGTPIILTLSNSPDTVRTRQKNNRPRK